MAKKIKNNKTTQKEDSAKTVRDEIVKDPNNRIQKKYVIPAVIVVLIIGLLFLFKSLFLAAIVNGQPISRLSIIQELEKQGGKRTLDNTITKILVLQEANKHNIAISQKEVDTEIKKIEDNIAKQGIKLDQALQAQGMTRNELIDQIKLQLLAQKLVEKDIKVTDKEIDDYINNNKTQIPQGLSQEDIKNQVSQQLKQQKLQQKIQELITKLKEKAKITYLIQY